MRSGRTVFGQQCPRCHRYSVVYNGNYFCEDDEKCGWVMGSRNQPRRIIVAFLQQEYERARQNGNGKEMESMKRYLKEMGEEPHG